MKEQRIERLKIGDRFIYHTVEYTRIETKFKNCCTPEYNAISISGEYILIPYNSKVIVIEESI